MRLGTKAAANPEEPMNQPDPTALRVASALLRYVGQQDAKDPLRHASTRHFHHLARLAVKTLSPRVRDIEVTNRRPVGPDPELALNETERLVLELLPSELETDQIAEVLGLTKGRVQAVQKSLHKLLGSNARHRTVAVAQERGLLRLDEGLWRAARASEALTGASAGDSPSEVVSGALAGAQGVGGAA
jgi:DNA-binding CsgD family transcriptional regulator